MGFGKRGAYFFLIDVFIGSFIFVLTLIMIFSFQSDVPELGALQDQIESYSGLLFDTEVRDYTNTVKDNFRLNGLIPQQTMTTDEVVLYLLSTSRQTNATQLLASVTQETLPSHVGVQYLVNDTVIYSRNIAQENLSLTRLGQKKITFARANATTLFGPNVTEVILWR